MLACQGSGSILCKNTFAYLTWKEAFGSPSIKNINHPSGESASLAPLSVEGWDNGLHEISKLSSETILSAKNAESLLQAIGDILVLVIAGAEDSQYLIPEVS
ncbi:hypothetical protein JHK85_056258 [Glycine max]|nr:hypothetical protein JHK87_055510 [Glycine soja]KAG4917977.1 hypothetical protein JHK85_056258 [Glycine max]